jgi:hypothetical protein
MRGGHGEQAFLTMKHFLFDWLKVCMQIAKAVIFFTGEFLPNFEKNHFQITRSS